MDTERSYTIDPVNEKDVEEIMNLLRRTFYVEEPMNAAVGLCSEGADACPDLDEYCSSAMLSGLSFKVVSDEGQIVSVIISGDYHPTQKLQTGQEEESIDEIDRGAEGPKLESGRDRNRYKKRPDLRAGQRPT
ncbi:hypothetical protein EVAR_22526_1 [Eumeta japonica]|uniref:Dopamine N-acetyltransferase n=1 Tax=Eumeta variegata TaxID=151549 RepID=A0A4C1U817_EUMVA|nr:hypothetical protein EVAR_22526_1 [Eumeta japonica]